jgi:hypothetical protein
MLQIVPKESDLKIEFSCSSDLDLIQRRDKRVVGTTPISLNIGSVVNPIYIEVLMMLLIRMHRPAKSCHDICISTNLLSL